MFLGVDWGAFVVVFLVALAATAVVVVFFSLGLRLLADGQLEPGTSGTGAGAGVAAGAAGAGAAGAPGAASPGAAGVASPGAASAAGPGAAGVAGAVRTPASTSRPASRTVGGWACIAVGAAAVLYSLYLIIPQFH